MHEMRHRIVISRLDGCSSTGDYFVIGVSKRYIFCQSVACVSPRPVQKLPPLIDLPVLLFDVWTLEANLFLAFLIRQKWGADAGVGTGMGWEGFLQLNIETVLFQVRFIESCKISNPPKILIPYSRFSMSNQTDLTNFSARVFSEILAF